MSKEKINKDEENEQIVFDAKKEITDLRSLFERLDKKPVHSITEEDLNNIKDRIQHAETTIEQITTINDRVGALEALNVIKTEAPHITEVAGDVNEDVEDDYDPDDDYLG